jgi:hypothetical protein
MLLSTTSLLVDCTVVEARAALKGSCSFATCVCGLVLLHPTTSLARSRSRSLALSLSRSLFLADDEHSIHGWGQEVGCANAECIGMLPGHTSTHMHTYISKHEFAHARPTDTHMHIHTRFNTDDSSSSSKHAGPASKQGARNAQSLIWREHLSDCTGLWCQRPE